MTLPDWLLSDGLKALAGLAGPPLAVCLVLGIAGAIVQTTTQIRETALTFVPKVVGVVLLIAVAGQLMLGFAEAYTKHVITHVSAVIHVVNSDRL